MDKQTEERPKGNNLKNHILNAVVASSIVAWIVTWIVFLATGSITVQDGGLGIACGVGLAYLVLPSTVLGLLSGVIGNIVGYSPDRSKIAGAFIGVACPILIWLILSNI